MFFNQLSRGAVTSLIVVLSGLSGVCSVAMADTFDFESPELKPDYIGKTYVNPSGKFELDTTGANAHGGRNSVKLQNDGCITMDYSQLTPDTNYRLCAWVKGTGAANLQIEWLGLPVPKSDYSSIKLTDKFQRIILTAMAPAGVKHAYLKFSTNKDGGLMWIDDISIEPVVIDPNAPLIDFETPLTQPGRLGKHYVNPSGNFSYDDSGANAHNGIGAMKLVDNGRITIDYQGVIPGKTYQMTASVKGEGNAVGQLQWLGANQRCDTRFLKLTNEYQGIKVAGIAPPGSTHLYLHMCLGNNAGTAWIDDIRFAEVIPETNTINITADFTGIHERFSIYNPREPVKMLIKGNGVTTPDNLKWRLCDYLDREVDQGVLAVTPDMLKSGIDFSVTPKLAGSYFLYMKLEKSGGTIPWKGSRLPGYVAFGVLPEIQALPLTSPEYSRFGGQGTNFIASGKFLNGDFLAPFYPAVGMKWNYNGRQLNGLEPTRGAFKERSADDYRKDSPPPPAVNNMVELLDLHGAPVHLLKLPSYLTGKLKLDNTAAQSYPLGDPSGYKELVGRVVRDSKARREAFFPNQKHNYYQLHWEPDWHWTGTEDEFIKYYETAREAIKENDPDARLMGANYGVISRGNTLMASLFKKGLNKYIDGVLMHLYFQPVSMEPEAAGLHNDCRQIRKLTNQYLGPDAMLINTEWGTDYQCDTRDAGHKQLMNHLYRFIRGHLIALGEGFNSTWFFYTTDYSTCESTSGEQGYGISFNTSSYIKEHQFGACSIEPKPTMMAAAAMTRLLEGTKTLGRLDQLPADIFAYSFRRGDENIIAIWRPDGSQKIQLPTGTGEVTCFDIMGNPARTATPAGLLTLTIDQYPQYILGVKDSVLPTALRNSSSIFAHARAEIAPGQSIKGLLRNQAPDRLVLKQGEKLIDIDKELPEKLAAGTCQLTAFDKSGNQQETMLLDITGLCSIGEIKAELNSENKLIFSLPVHNLSSKVQRFNFLAEYDGKEFARLTREIPAEAVIAVEIPGDRLNYEGLALKNLKISVSTDAGIQAVSERFFGALFPQTVGLIDIDGETGDWNPALFSRTFGAEALTYQQKRHRGESDFSANYALGVNGDNLYLAVKVRDDVAMPTTNPAQPWRDDSLTIALGRDSDDNGGFKEHRRFSFTRNADGKVLMQEVFGSPPKAVTELPAGTIKCAIKRNEEQKITTYEMEIPLRLIGSRSETLGLGITLDDVDSVEEVKQDIHREMSIAGGVPLFMMNVRFATLIFPKK